MRRTAIRNIALLSAAIGTAALAAAPAADSARRLAAIPDQSCLTPVAGDARADPAESAPVLMDGLGHAGIEADSDDPRVREWFKQGVRLIWAFDEEEAIRAFRMAQRLDPQCAMCFFGEAWARGPTINLQPRTEQLEAARTAARRALELADGLGARDRALIEGMALRAGEGEAFANDAYADFIEAAAERMPQDDTLAVMAADARMVVSTSMQPGSAAQRHLERVLARNPDHSGAIHFYIHLTDWTDEQRLAEPYADRLGRVAPAASHLVHMPSHTYYGVGRYRDAAAVNFAAIAADRAFVSAAAPPHSFYRWALLRHNMHFAINSALARGDGATALDVSRQYAAEYLTPGAGPRPDSHQDVGSRILSSAVYYAHGLHSAPADMLALPEPDHVQARVMRHYARGEALARGGEAAAVRAEAAAIARLRRGSDSPALGRGVDALAEVFQYVLEGRAAMMAGRPRRAERAYRRAMERQLAAGFGFDPPLFWYSVRRSLAAARLAQGDARGARDQLGASLWRWPGDPLALYALSLTERRLGNEREADRLLERARAAWAGDITQIPLARI